MSLLMMGLVGLGILYSVMMYAIAATLINMAIKDGSYDRGECSVSYDVVVLVLAPIMIPFEFFIHFFRGHNHV